MGDKVDCEVCVPEINDEVYDAFITLFKEADKDHDGKLSKSDFNRLVKGMGELKNAQHLFDIIDVDHDKVVSLDEFKVFAKAMSDVATNLDLTSFMGLIFKACDRGNKGHLTKGEFLKFMKYSGSPVGFFQRNKVFKKWDTDGNGTIDMDEIMGHLNFVRLG
jgi:Ca2+-binding EF-hand superfamily protein